MTVDELIEAFERHGETDYLKFEMVATRRSGRADLHAFLVLDELVPGARDIVAGAEHDEIWLDVSAEDLATVATDAIVLELVRCGVRWDSDVESLAMFA